MNLKFNLQNPLWKTDPQKAKEGFEKELKEKHGKLFQQIEGYDWADAHRDDALSKLIQEILGESQEKVTRCVTS